MGLDDPEDVIPGIIAFVAVLGIIGALTTFIPVIATVPVLNIITSTIHNGFVLLGGLLTPYIGIDAFYVAVMIEALLTILCIWIIVHFGI